jgi:ABC-type transport system involved in cytochrome bd biosynthesis fused ATPase/permease subunit
MKSNYEQEEMKQIEKEYQEAEAREQQKHAKYRWHWSPKGILVAIVAITLLIGAAYTSGIVSYIMIAIGILLILAGWIRFFKKLDETK